jgi:integrase
MGRPRKKDPHLPPCVHPKHGAYYYVKGGKWIRLGETLADALTAYAALHETPKGGMPALIDEVIMAMKARKPPLADSTLKQYEGAAKILKRKFVQFAPEQVKSKHVALFKRELAGTPNMANRCMSVLRQVFDYALEEQLPGVDGNPAVGIKRHKEGKRDRLISWEEYGAVYAKSGARLQVITDLLIRTGQRITAVLRIKRTNLLPEGIRFGHHKTPTKGIVKWTPELREVVERAKALRGNVRSLDWLLTGRTGKPPDYRTVKDQWDKVCERAGVEDATLHDLRALAATEAEKQGMNPTALLQHSSPAQTRRYLRGKEEPVVDGPSFRRLIDSDAKKP